MTVFATSFMRGDTHDSGMWSVDCTPTRYLAHVEADDRWWPPTGIEVQVGPNGPDGPDGNWDQGRACPDGFILDTW